MLVELRQLSDPLVLVEQHQSQNFDLSSRWLCFITVAAQDFLGLIIQTHFEFINHFVYFVASVQDILATGCSPSTQSSNFISWQPSSLTQARHWFTVISYFPTEKRGTLTSLNSPSEKERP